MTVSESIGVLIYGISLILEETHQNEYRKAGIVPYTCRKP